VCVNFTVADGANSVVKPVAAFADSVTCTVTPGAGTVRFPYRSTATTRYPVMLATVDAEPVVVVGDRIFRPVTGPATLFSVNVAVPVTPAAVAFTA
jgi:hypothetical protein